MGKEIQEMELSPENEALLRESLTAWKEEVYAEILEEVEKVKAEKIEELEEANSVYLSQIKEEYAEKFVKGLDEMKQVLRAEIISEMVDTNPELQILEKVKEIIAPTLNEEYIGNIYAEEIKTLREENEILKRNAELEEGARTLAELLEPYSDTTQKIVLSLVKEGNSEEVTEQFYSLIEGIELLEAKEKSKDEEEKEEDDEEEEEDDEDDDEDDDDEEEDGDDDEDDKSKEADKAKKDKAAKDKEKKVEESTDDSFINEEAKGSEKPKKVSGLLKEMRGLAN